MKRWVIGSAVLVVLGIVLLVGTVVVGARWWDGGEVGVPRDGASYEVTLADAGSDYAIWSEQHLVDPRCSLTDAEGSTIPLQRVPEEERVYVQQMGIGKPEASFLFTAPTSEPVAVTCDPVGSTPPATVAIGPAPDRRLFALLNWGTPLLGVTLLILGVVAVPVTLLRETTRRRGTGTDGAGAAGTPTVSGGT